MHPTLTKIADLLNSPPEEYRPYPFWFWNANLSRDEIAWQLEECRRQKILAVLIHPRHGLVTPYLGEAFMAMVVYTVQEAARLGMKVWLYDEYNWPSGTVAGRLLRDYPQFKMRFLHHEYREADGGCVIQQSGREDGFLGVQAIHLDSGDLQTISPGETLPPGRWGLAEFRLAYPTIALDCVSGHAHAAPESGYLDVLNPDAVAKFIELTHDVYYRHLREYFGSVILGFFTDEPGVIYDFDYSYDFDHAMTHNLPWTGALESHFRQVKGYPLRDKLIHLTADAPGAQQTRQDYWDVVGELYVTAYHRQLCRWCADHGIAYTGHVVCEEMSLHYQGDIHAGLKQFHIPGLDWTSKECTPETAPIYSTAKMVSSIAHRYGRKFTLCETYGATGWELTFTDMKRVLDYLYVLGVNQMCLHGFFYSVRAARAHECPPSEFFQSPGWTHMSLYSDYTARLGALLSQGRHYCATGILVPTRSYQAQNNRTFLDPAGKPAFYAQTLNQLGRFLLEKGIDFEFIADSSLKETALGKHGIEWGDERIDTLIIPPCAALDPELQAKLDQFQTLGGTLIPVPDISTATGQRLCRELADRRVRLFEDEQESQGLLVYRRILPDTSILCFACNATTIDRPGASLVFPEAVQVREIDLERPGFNDVEFSCRRKNTRVRAGFRPHQARMFLLTRPETLRDLQLSPAARVSHLITPGPEWTILAEKENVLKLSQFLQIPLPGGTRFEIHARVTCDDGVGPVRLLLEGDGYQKITVNQRDVTDRRRPCRYFDSDQFAIDLTDGLRVGENRISLEYAPTPGDTVVSGLMACAGIHAILPHLFLIGDFSVTSECHLTQPVITLKTGAWQAQGFPYYAGTITYRTEILIAPAELGSGAILTCDVGGAGVEVIVNGIPCGTRIWEPYDIAITPALRTGKNSLELKVTNTALDLLRPLPSEVNTDNPHAFLRGNNQSHPPSGLIMVKIAITR